MSTISGDLEDIVAVSAGNGHVLVLDENGNVWAWGDNYYGQLGEGSSGVGEYETTPVQVKIDEDTFLTDIVYTDAGFQHSMAIDRYGNIWVWGDNESGQLGLGEGIGDQVYAVKID